MFNSLAKSDIEKLRASGCVVTDADVIALNDSAIAISQASEFTEATNAPRIGWADTIPIHEPTLQSESWCENYAVQWFPKQGASWERLFAWFSKRTLSPLAYARAFALAHARDTGFFKGLTDKQIAIKSVVKWACSLPCTDGQLMGACLYATFGSTIESEEHPFFAELREKQKTKTPKEYHNLIEECIAYGIGLSVEELQTHTHGELFRIIRKYAEYQMAIKGMGSIDKEAMKKKLIDLRFENYILLLDSIKARKVTI